MEFPVEFVKIQNLLPWLENKLSTKYELSLLNLRLSFHTLHNTFKQMIDLAWTAIEFFGNNKLYEQSQQMLENCINNIQQIINEHPNCIYLQFCVSFLDQINQRVGIIHANFHPLIHFELPSYIVQILDKFNSGFDMIQELIVQIQKFTVQSFPILKHIEDSLNLFKIPIKMFLDQSKEFNNFQHQQKYIQEFNEFVSQTNKQSTTKNGVLVRKMIQLIKQSCLNQLKMETILDSPMKLSQIIKNKGRKILNDDLKSESQNLILKYVNLLVKNDFIQKDLQNINVEELYQMIDLLKCQNDLIEEYKKQSNNLIDIELMFTNKRDFLSYYNQWLQCIEGIKEIEENKSYQKEILAYKQSLKVTYKDVRKFSDVLYDFQQYIVQYQRLKILFNKLQHHVQKYFLREYQERIQLIWSD